VPVVTIRVRVPAAAGVGEELEYRLCVENCSAAPAHHVLVRNPIPSNARFVRASPEPAARDPELLWQLGTLEPGVCRELVLVLMPTGPGDLKNCARVQFEHGQCVCTRIAPPAGEARLTLTKTGPEKRYVNTGAAYQLTVRNAGSVPLTNVVITDPVPAQMAYVSSRGGQFVANEVRWAIGTLEPSAAQTVDVVLKARSAGTVCNRAIATADHGQKAEAEACTEFVGVSGLLLEVVDTKDPVEVGAETSYVILVRNQGTRPATEIRIEAEVPEQMDVVRVTGPADHRLDGRKLVFQSFNLTPQGEARFVVYVKAKAPGDVRFKVDLWAKELFSGLPVHEEESTTIFTDLPSARLPGRPKPRTSQSRKQH
jgi:uncharacterized repeat protein (TIGR01451 family)